MAGMGVTRRLAALAMACAVCGIALARVAQAQGPDDLARLRAEVSRLFGQGKYADAIPIAQRYFELARQRHGEDHPEFVTAITALAAGYRAQGRLAEAEPLYRRGLAIVTKARGPDHPDVAQLLNDLAGLYQDQGRLAEAEPLYKRSLVIREMALGPEHISVGASLNNLANLYQAQGRLAEAEPLYRRDLAIIRKAQGNDHPAEGALLANLAALYRAQGRLAEAEPLLRRSLTLIEKAIGAEHPQVATLLNSLAGLYQDQGRLAEAEPLFRRGLAIAEKALGAQHPTVGTSLNWLAGLYLAQGRFAESEPLYLRSLAIAEKALGPEHPGVSLALNNLAELYRNQARYAEAEPLYRRSLAIHEKTLGPDHGNVALSLNNLALLHRNQGRLGEAGPLFRRSLAIRERALGPDHPIVAAVLNNLAGLSLAQRDAGAEKALAERLGAIDARLAETGRKLAKDFPDYAALSSPTPTSVSEVQAQLGDDEAMVLFLDTPEWQPLPEETFIWVVTRTEARWVRSDFGTAAIIREVAALRCGLDNSLWGDKDTRTRCVELLKAQRYDAKANVPPFPVARAHVLYKTLFGEVEDLIMGKHLLLVPSGALTQLPFQVLVTVPPKATVPEEAAGYRQLAWLGARQPITVLPAVSSLKALRAHAKSSRAGKVYLGIGNPLLDGHDARYAELAKKARAIKSCPVAPTPVARLDTRQGGVAPVEIRGGLANVVEIRTQTPLPETADELCAVARDLKADVSEVRLGDRATETELKRLSKSGELARYRVLHFATHGAMAGELSSAREPGLILTPPDKASEEDDGYLSASEIAALKLDADWVILSACNTAARGATSAEALSGIARAFVYAGARALLVSHWAVDSNATVKLITTAAAEMARDPTVGRAEAMRRAMLALLQSGTQEAHPSHWAPFVVVGEGAASSTQ